MSLINPKNFMDPLTNIWHLATIAVVALLFGVYRAAGGGIDLEKIKKTPEARYQAAEEYAAKPDSINRQDPNLRLPAKENAAVKKPKVDPLLGDLLNSDTADSEDRGKNNEKSSLDDIAKQLGVE